MPPKFRLHNDCGRLRTVSVKQADLTTRVSKVTRRNGSSGDYHPGMLRLVHAVDGYSFRFEIENSTQN